MRRSRINVWNKFQNLTEEIEKNLEKIGQVVDVDDYYQELTEITSQVGDNNMTLSIDTFDSKKLKSSLPKLDLLKKKIENEVEVFYNIDQTCTFLNDNLELKEEKIDQVTNVSIHLLSLLKRAKTNDKYDLENVYDNGLETLHKVLVQEQIYGRTTLVDKINGDRSNSVIKEKLFDHFVSDLQNINDPIAADIKNINGSLNYNYLTTNIIDKIVESQFSQEKDTYLANKENKKRELQNAVTAYNRRYKELDGKLDDVKTDIRSVRLHRGLNKTKLLSYVLVPVLIIGGGYHLGKALSNRIDEYRTITRMVNPVTQEVVGTMSDIYDERETTYTSTLKIYEPWKKTNEGYSRNVTAYVTDPSVTFVDGNNLHEKYHYVEVKEKLEETDSTEESTTLLIETVQDKTDTRKSTKFIIPLTIAAVLLAGLFDGVLGYNMGVESVQRALWRLKEELDRRKVDKASLVRQSGELSDEGKELVETCLKEAQTYQFDTNDMKSFKVSGK